MTQEKKKADVEDDQTMRTLSRGLRVLKMVNQHGSLTATKIAKLTDLAYPTASRIIGALVVERLLEREGNSKSYRPTALVQTLSHGYREDPRFLALCRARMMVLTQDLRWPLSLSTRIGMSMVVRETTYQSVPLSLHVFPVGHSMHLLRSASGRACLAFGDDADKEAAFDYLVRSGSEAVVPLLRNSLDHINATGYSLSDAEMSTEHPTDMAAIAVPIRRRSGYDTTLTVTYIASWMSREKALQTCLPGLKQAADDIMAGLAECG